MSKIDTACAESPCGLYIHVPFCAGKCPYCDFYSVTPDEDTLERYTAVLIDEMEQAARRYCRADQPISASTVYFGGGTPPLLGVDRLVRVLDAARRIFSIAADAEITVEANPRNVTPGLMDALVGAGVNRLSMGAQSGVDSELAALGRRHTAAQVTQAVATARQAGVRNLSLDLMLAIPGQTADSLTRSIDVIAACEPEHISAYLLKLEPGTPFFARRDALALPDDDTQAELYLLACERLERCGYAQYEISNFARPGRESRHNLKYWNDECYLGFGPSAHSFFAGRRFFYPRGLSEFIEHARTTDDGEGGSREEYAMLRLRLADGLTETGWSERFGGQIPESMRDRARPLANAGLLQCDANGVRLTRAGFVLSNAVIGRLLD